MKRIIILTGIACFLGISLICPAPGQAARPAQKGKWVEKEFYRDGKMKSYKKYAHGELLRRRSYYKNGRLQLDYVYKQGIITSKRQYYENGKLKSIWSRKTGVVKFYDENGKLKHVRNDKADMAEQYKSSYFFTGP